MPEKTRATERVAAKSEPVNGKDRPTDCRLCGQEVRAGVGRVLFPYPVSDDNQFVPV